MEIRVPLDLCDNVDALNPLDDAVTDIKPITAADIKNMDAAMDAYKLAVGKVATNWNWLQEDLAQLFALVTGLDYRAAHAIWYSLNSDRAQRNMLRDVIQATRDQWTDARYSSTADDLIWLIGEADSVASHRNNAIHSPCMPSVGTKEIEIIPYDFFRSPRTQKLRGKDILTEFEWYAKSAETLTSFARQAWSSLRSENNQWPKRPEMPARPVKKAAL